jgi:predicted Holliday junction resolvase-like endonuclease
VYVMVTEIAMLVMFIIIVVLVVMIIQKRDQVSYLNRLCDKYSQKLIDERRSMSIERERMRSNLYEAKRSYKRAESKFKL